MAIRARLRSVSRKGWEFDSPHAHFDIYVMKKLLALAFFFSILPATASAAWWSPLSWDVFQLKSTAHQDQPVSGISTSKVSATSSTPTIADLQAQVADLQRQLADALEKIQTLSGKTSALAGTAKSTTTSPNTSSDKQILAKVTSAVVLVETATSSGSGVIIDSQGHILTTAHTIWTKDDSNTVVDVSSFVSVTFSNGTKKPAKVIGIDEANDTAIIQLLSKSSSSYLKLNYDSGIASGDKVYIASFPINTTDSVSGYGFISGTISRKGTDAIETTATSRPIDNGGAMLNDAGGVIGIPRITSCKVLEDMTHCLKYSITVNNIRTLVPKLLAGMRLYKQKKIETAEESLVHGTLTQMYNDMSQSGVLDYAIRDVTGQNSFDSFNSRLNEDQEGKITRIYLSKLKLAAESIYQAVDFLKSKTYDLNVFFLTEDSNIALMGDYERKIIGQIESANAAKEKEYEAKVAYWSKKKNEYDGMIADQTKASHNYLMQEGVVVESAADYLTNERQTILNMFTGENVNIF